MPQNLQEKLIPEEVQEVLPSEEELDIEAKIREMAPEEREKRYNELKKEIDEIYEISRRGSIYSDIARKYIDQLEIRGKKLTELTRFSQGEVNDAINDLLVRKEAELKAYEKGITLPTEIEREKKTKEALKASIIEKYMPEPEKVKLMPLDELSRLKEDLDKIYGANLQDDKEYQAALGKEEGFTWESGKKRLAFIIDTVWKKEARSKELTEATRALGITFDILKRPRLRRPDDPTLPGSWEDKRFLNAVMKGYMDRKGDRVGQQEVINDVYRYLGLKPPYDTAKVIPFPARPPETPPSKEKVIEVTDEMIVGEIEAPPPLPRRYLDGLIKIAKVNPEVVPEEITLEDFKRMAEKEPEVGNDFVDSVKESMEEAKAKPSKWGWIKERLKGFFTGGFAEYRHALKFRRAVKENAEYINKMAKTVSEPAWKENAEKNDEIVEDTIKKCEERLKERLAKYRDEYGRPVATDERLANFRDRLREKLRAQRDNQIEFSIKEYQRLIKESIDPKYWRRYIYGAIDSALWAATGIGVYLAKELTMIKTAAAAATGEALRPAVEQAGEAPPTATALDLETVRGITDHIWGECKRIAIQYGVEPTNALVRKMCEAVCRANEIAVKSWGIPGKIKDVALPEGYPVDFSHAIEMVKNAAGL